MSTTLSASHPGVTYSPVNAWTSNQDGAIITSQTGALAIVEFQGVFVQVFGTISSFNPKPVSLYTMDDGVPLTFNASNFPISESSPNSTLFLPSHSRERKSFIINFSSIWRAAHLEFCCCLPPGIGFHVYCFSFNHHTNPSFPLIANFNLLYRSLSF
ncbi:hypothetical protein BDP27DRAFT_700623 [Rhodocollybia butyracea]|uniref:Uncharacterized protein n=1 Tax=Rhodocollybia butyracea TaxID=206335 RepID=A0A9P5Q8U5_9AGAR|nr:hypothetical protein BDP27DRAFT_700623 [Rhodocollybia butyracea]